MQIDKKTIFIIIGVVLAGLLAYFMYCSHVYDNGSGAKRVEQQLGTAAAEQQQTTNSIKSAESTADGIGTTANAIESRLNDTKATTDRIAAESNSAAKSVSDAKNTTAECREIVNSSAGLISRSAEILNSVRERGQSTN